jgi:hypothetical protein
MGALHRGWRAADADRSSTLRHGSPGVALVLAPAGAREERNKGDGMRIALAVATWLTVLVPTTGLAAPAVFVEDQAVWKTPEAFEQAVNMKPEDRRSAIACEAKAGTRIESIGAARGSWLWLVEIKSGPNVGCRGVVKPLSFRTGASPTPAQPAAAPVPPPPTLPPAAAEVSAPPPVQKIQQPELEPVDVAAEVDLLKRQLGAVSDTEGQCLAAAASGGVSSSSQSGGSYQSRSSSSSDSSFSATSRPSGYRGRTSSDSYSSSSSSADGGSASYGSSSTYTTPAMRTQACRVRAQASREGLAASIELAGRDPVHFAAIIRENRARERQARAERAAWFDLVVTTVASDLEALSASTLPTLDDWSFRLESLEGGLAQLWKSASSDGKATTAIHAVQRAIDGCRLVRNRLTLSAQHEDEATIAQQTAQSARQRLTASMFPTTARLEIESHEHNARMAKERSARFTKQTETEWRRSLPATQAALKAVMELRAAMAAAPPR